MDNALLLEELHHTIERLADAVADEPTLAVALRRFADALDSSSGSVEAPQVSPRRASISPREPLAFRTLLCHALDVGALDERRYDWLMLAENRVCRSDQQGA